MEDTEKSKFRIGKIAGLFILFIPVFFFIAMNFPNWFALIHYGPCYDAMEDAFEIATAMDDYFEGNVHRSITRSEIEKLVKEPIGNPWTITKKANEYVLQVTDGSGKCPATYQKRYLAWTSGIYTIHVNVD